MRGSCALTADEPIHVVNVEPQTTRVRPVRDDVPALLGIPHGLLGHVTADVGSDPRAIKPRRCRRQPVRGKPLVEVLTEAPREIIEHLVGEGKSGVQGVGH